MDIHLGGMVVAQHELQHAMGQMEDAAGFTPPYHLQAHTRPDSHGGEPLAQGRVGGHRLHAHLLTFPGLTEGHDGPIRKKRSKNLDHFSSAMASHRKQINDPELSIS
jgi:hypothetical protein